MYIYSYINVCVYVYICVHICKYPYPYTRVCMCRYICVLTYMYMCMCRYICLHTYMYIHIEVSRTDAYIHQALKFFDFTYWCTPVVKNNWSTTYSNWSTICDPYIRVQYCGENI